MRRIILISLTALLAIGLLLIAVFGLRTYIKIAAMKKATPAKAAVIPAKPKYVTEQVKLFSFSSPDALNEWEEKAFKGKVSYSIEKGEDPSYVRAKSDSSASAMYYKIKMDAKRKHPVIRWKWRVEKFPAKKSPETLETQDEHDFAGRVYVVFPTLFILNSQVLEYIWAQNLPVGSTGTSPYSKNIKLMVLESGSPKDAGFVSEERDVVADYTKMFGGSPEHNMGAVAFMTNAEHTKTSADAMYDEIELGYKEE